MPDGKNRQHCGEGPVTAWEKLCGSREPAGAGIPLPRHPGISVNDGYDSDSFIGQTGGGMWLLRIWSTTFIAGTFPIK